jgi:hypothetical protein
LSFIRKTLAHINKASSLLIHTLLTHAMFGCKRIIPGAKMVFVETSIFTAQIKRIATDDEYGALQSRLVRNPLAGMLVPGGGGIRKIRFAIGGRGKRDGARAIYYFQAAADRIYMLVAYPKSVKADLSNEETAILRELVKVL